MTNRLMPELLKQFHAINIDYSDLEIDYEPYDDFMSANETANWIKAWTKNHELDGEEYLIFGQDGTGGYVAIWYVEEEDLLNQPIVFFGSEGEHGIIACNLYEFFWLFAYGYGPYEALMYLDEDVEYIENDELYDFATENADSFKGKPYDIVLKANAKYPDFEDEIKSLTLA